MQKFSFISLIILFFLFITISSYSSQAPGIKTTSFQKTINEFVEQNASEEGFRLVAKKNISGIVPENSKEMHAVLKMHSAWISDTAGFDTVDKLDANGNPLGNDKLFTLEYSGFFYVKNTGNWKFAVNSASATELRIDGMSIIEWFGSHEEGDIFERHSATVHLEQGWHYLHLYYIAGGNDQQFIRVVFKDPLGEGWLPLDKNFLDIRSYPIQNGFLMTTAGTLDATIPTDSMELYYAVDISSIPDGSHTGYGIVDAIHHNSNPYGENKNFVSKISGWIYVAASDGGQWEFSINSSGAADLEIDNEIVTSWYGSHDAETPDKHSHKGTINLEPGWHELIFRYAHFSDNAPIMSVTFKKPGENIWKVLSTSNINMATFAADIDCDGLSNELESIMGTERDIADSDGDMLTDFAEAMIGSNPLSPDTNNDGLGDFSELVSDNYNEKSGKYENIWNSDNDGDGVTDGKDLSPSVHSEVRTTFNLTVRTGGKPTWLDFQLRPANPMNLMLMNKHWNWPYDKEGQMRDRDNSKKDVTLIPMLVLSTGMAPDQSNVYDSGIQIADDSKIASLDSRFFHNDGFGTGNVLNTEGESQIIVAWDKSSKIVVRNRQGRILKKFNSVFTTGDKLLIGDFIGNSKDEIAVLHKTSKEYFLALYSGEGQLLLKKEIVKFNESCSAAAGNYWEQRNGSKDELMIACPDTGKIITYTIEKWHGYNMSANFSSADKFTFDDGFAVGDVDGDGTVELLVADNDNDILNIYSYESGNFYKKIYTVTGFDFDLSDKIAGMDVLESNNPADPRFGEEIVILKKSGGMKVYTEKTKSNDGNRDDVDYSTFDGVSVSDLNGDGHQEIFIGSDTSGVVNVYNPKYKKAIIPLFPVVENGNNIAFQGRMIYSATGKEPVIFTAEAKLVWFVVGYTDSKEDPLKTTPIVLAQYEDPFMLTGFTATEQRGTKVGIGYGLNKDDIGNAYLRIKTGFINGIETFEDAITSLTQEITGIKIENTEVSGEMEASEWTDDKLKEIITGSSGLPNGIYPVLMFASNTSASLDLSDIIADESQSSGALLVDLYKSDSLTVKSVKMNWYDTKRESVIPLTLKDMKNEIENWDLGNLKEELAIAVTAGADMAEISLSTTCRACYPERYTPLDWTKKGFSIAKTILYDSYSEIGRLRESVKYFKDYLKAAPKFKGIPQSYKWKEFYSMTREERLLSGMSGKVIQGAKALKMPKAGRFLATKGGVVMAVLTGLYVGGSMALDSGGSASDLAMAAVYGSYYVAYGLVLSIIGATTPVGPIVAGIVAAVDVIWAFCNDGDGFSDEIIQWIAENISDTLQVDPDFQLTYSGVTISDYGNNGLTVGDRIEIKFRGTETIWKSKSHDVKWWDPAGEMATGGYDEDDVLWDMNHSYLKPSACIIEKVIVSSNYNEWLSDNFNDFFNDITIYRCAENSDRYDAGHFRYLVKDSRTNVRKRRIWDFGAWIEPKLPSYDFKTVLRLKTYFKGWYGQCTNNVCDRKSMEDSYTNKVSFHFDILPDTLEDFLKWNAIVPLDRDFDGLNDENEGLTGDDAGPWFTVSGINDTGNEGFLSSGSRDVIWREYVTYGDFESYYHWGIDFTSSSALILRNRHRIDINKFPYVVLSRNKLTFGDDYNADHGLWETEAAKDGLVILYNHDYNIDHPVTLPDGNPQDDRRVYILPEGDKPFYWNISAAGGPSDPDDIDTDDDGLIDSYEINAWVKGIKLDPLNSDTDDDGLNDFEELILGTDPTDIDSDGDGLTDKQEIDGWIVTVNFRGMTLQFRVFSDPLREDTDNDGLNDFDEYTNSPKLNPISYDSDGDRLSDSRDNDPMNFPSGELDSDNDGIPDKIEQEGWDIVVTTYNGTEHRHVSSSAFNIDTDIDGLSDYEEYLATDPTLSDTDNDGLTDLQEKIFGSNPLDYDSDKDLLNDFQEFGYNTNPNKEDSDSDNLTDYYEIFISHTDPLKKDTDSDNFPDNKELALGTNPFEPDTDNDNIKDGNEVGIYFTNPLLADTDGDKLSDGDEVYIYHTNPLLADTDGDNISDFDEIKYTGTDPNLLSSDNDTLTDYQELYVYNTLPLNADPDNDELKDDEELAFGTNPFKGDTDNDMFSDIKEIKRYFTNPLKKDTDDDGLTESQEIYRYFTSPVNSDTDGDGISDYWDPDTYFPLPSVSKILVIYDDFLERQDEFIDMLTELAANVGIDIEVKKASDVPDLHNYQLIIMLGQPDDSGVSGTVSDLMFKLVDSDIQNAMLAETNAIANNVTGDELRQAMLESIRYRFYLSAVPVYNGLPENGYGQLPPPTGVQVSLGLENSIIVMLSKVMRGDAFKVITYFKLLEKYFRENLELVVWPDPQPSSPTPSLSRVSDFNVPLNNITQAEVSGTLYESSTYGMAATVFYPDSLTPHQLRENLNCLPGDIVVDRYVLVEAAAGNLDTSGNVVSIEPVISSATIRIYYKAIELDRSTPRDGDALDAGDIDENTLSIYRWDETSEQWIRLSDTLPWVTSVTLHTDNITVNGINWDGYIQCTVTDRLGLFSISGNPRPDLTPAGNPRVTTTIPANGDFGVKPDAEVRIFFNEPINLETMRGISITNSYVTDIALDNDNMSIRIFHTDFAPGITYEVTIPELSVSDLAGNRNTDNYSFSFTTEDINNVPFAQDDFFQIKEGVDIANLSVLDNNGNGPDYDSENDPIVLVGVNGSSNLIGTYVTGTNGGIFRIDASGKLSFSQSGEFDYLAEGMETSSSVVYSLSDGYSMASATVTVTITGVNNPPVMSGHNRRIMPISENAGDDDGTGNDLDDDFNDNHNNQGTSVKTILESAGTIVDPDSPSIGVAIKNVFNINGVWQYYFAGQWYDIPENLSESRSLLLDEESRIRFVPAPNHYGTDNGYLVISAWDKSEFSSGTVADTRGNNSVSSSEAMVGVSVWHNTGSSITIPEDDDLDGISNQDEDLNGNGNLADDDTDRDGIPDYLDPDDDNDGFIEYGTVDGNGDGIQDRLQTNVVTVSKYTLAVNPAYKITEMTVTNPPYPLPRGVGEMPYGLLNFKVSGFSAGSKINVEIYVPINEELNGYIKEINRGEWINFDTEIMHLPATGVTKVTLQIKDGDIFDIDHKVNAEIEDPGGFYVKSSNMVSDVPALSDVSIFVLSAGILLFAIRKIYSGQVKNN